MQHCLIYYPKSWWPDLYDRSCTILIKAKLSKNIGRIADFYINVLNGNFYIYRENARVNGSNFKFNAQRTDIRTMVLKVSIAYPSVLHLLLTRTMSKTKQNTKT